MVKIYLAFVSLPRTFHQFIRASFSHQLPSKMALKAQEIREGLFSISWFIQCPQTKYSPPSTHVEVEVDIKENLKCSLSYRSNYSMYLEMKIVDPPESILRRILVTATYGGVKQKMALNESSWKTTFHHDQNQPYFKSGGYGSPMITTYVSSFEILIDLKPRCMLSVKKSAKNILEHLEKLRDKKTLYDVTFSCGDELIKAHTFILACGSSVLAAMFQHNFKRENRERTVLIEDIEAKVFENLIHYLYVGECPLLENEEQDGEEVADLLVAADKYAVNSLKEECVVHLSKTLSAENATKYLVLAHLHNSTDLHESVLDFIAKNAKAVVSQENFMEMLKAYPELCYQAVKHIVMKSKN